MTSDCCASEIRKPTKVSSVKPQSITKDKVISATGSLSGGMSILSSYNVCHSICMGVIAALSVFGVAVAGFPLAFLLPYQPYFWAIGIAILVVALILYTQAKHSLAVPSGTGSAREIKGPCISKHMILANAGLLVSGIPFAKSQFSSYLLLTIGLVIVAAAIALYLKEAKWTKK